MKLEHAGAQLTRSAEAPRSLNAATRQGENFLDQDQDQLQRITNLMRRVEDLADRLSGPIPTTSVGADQHREQPAGFIGALTDLHMSRDLVSERMAVALNRIEQVL